jgi:DNA-binding MarR family transcriptional regulator
MGIVPALVRGSFLIERVYAESARQHGITPQQGVLMCVLMAGALGMTELGQTMGLAKSSLTGLVNRTEANGFVARSADPDDTRAVTVALTAQGDTVVQEFYDETCRRIDALAQGLSPSERTALGSLLGRVVLDNEAPVVFLGNEGR